MSRLYARAITSENSGPPISRERAQAELERARRSVRTTSLELFDDPTKVMSALGCVRGHLALATQTIRNLAAGRFVSDGEDALQVANSLFFARTLLISLEKQLMSLPSDPRVALASLRSILRDIETVLNGTATRLERPLRGPDALAKTSGESPPADEPLVA